MRDALVIERKKEDARRWKGVFYDTARDAFVAEIWVEGKRRYLGRFGTAVEAGLAYSDEREANPIVRKAPDRQDTFAEAYEGFLDSCERDKRDNPIVGDGFLYRGQMFDYVGLTFAKVRGKAFPYYQFEADCLACGEPFETMIASFGATGITRNCEKHRKRLSWANPKTGEPVKRQMSEIGQAIMAHVERCAVLASLADDQMDLGEFAQFCLDQDKEGIVDRPELMRSSIRRWGEREDTPYCVTDVGDGKPFVMFP